MTIIIIFHKIIFFLKKRKNNVDIIFQYQTFKENLQFRIRIIMS